MLDRTKQYLLAVLLVPCVGFAGMIKPFVIGGELVPEGEFEEVVQLKFEPKGKCSATIVGPRAVLTAAHCPDMAGETATFEVGGQTHSVTFHVSNLWTGQSGLDLAIGVTEEVVDVTPVSIAGDVAEGTNITMVGYGCYEIEGPFPYPIGQPKYDDKKRKATIAVSSMEDYDMHSKKNALALCKGDSGGPAFIEEEGVRSIVGVASRSNMYNTSIHARTDLEESVAFFEKMAQELEIQICGVNHDC